MATKETSRCWPGYEPVPGKKQHEQGSCRKKAASKSTPSEKAFQSERQHQLDEWQKKHTGTRRSAAQHLSAPASRTPKKRAGGSAAKTAKKRKPSPPKKRS